MKIQKTMVKDKLCEGYVADHIGGRGTSAAGRKLRQVPQNSLKDMWDIFKYKKGRDFRVLEKVKVASKKRCLPKKNPQDNLFKLRIFS